MANALSAAGFALVLLGVALSVAYPAGGVAVGKQGGAFGSIDLGWGRRGENGRAHV